MQINWNTMGGFYYIPLEVQKRVFEETGKEKYIKLPTPGMNLRGVY
ncbi:MAG: ThaI family type II restriction endonuclease [candidate division WOR-3 bacterium]|nr:ThaI family type II restriction endonuclease [candidate division WOR-3 bacterium]